MGGDGLDEVKIPLLQSTDENVVVRTVTFQISDIKCTSRVNPIELALANLSGVKSIAVSSLDGRAAVQFVPKLINAKRIKESIGESGFKVNEVHDHDQDISVCRIRIKGMTCTSCSESVEKALQMVDGVKRAIVGLALEEAKVNYDPSLADPGKIIEAIEDAGFGGAPTLKTTRNSSGGWHPHTYHHTIPISSPGPSMTLRNLIKLTGPVKPVSRRRANLRRITMPMTVRLCETPRLSVSPHPKKSRDHNHAPSRKSSAAFMFPSLIPLTVKLLHSSVSCRVLPRKAKEVESRKHKYHSHSTVSINAMTSHKVSLRLSTALHKEYADSKTLAEKELLMSYRKDENGNGGIEVVILAVGLVGGDALLSHILAGVALLTAQLKDNEAIHQSLKYLEDVCGKIPLVHVDDVCEAHIFCAKTSSINGRFLLANSYASSAEIANYYLQNYPEFNLNEKVDMENKKICSELNLSFWSQCEHHLLPFHGVVHIGYLLSDGFSPVGKSLLQSIVHFYGFKFSRCSYLRSLLRSAVINEFDLAKHRLKLLRRNPSSFTPCLDGCYLLLGADKDFNHSKISKFSQADANAYPKYESQLEKLCKFMDLVLDSSPPESYNIKHLLMAMNHLDKLFVMNDAATIVNELEVQHPAVKILILASKAQQEEIGDGINLTISFADELLHGVEELIRMGLHPSEIIRMLLVV